MRGSSSPRGRRRRQVQHRVGQPGQPRQRGRLVEIADQRRRAGARSAGAPRGRWTSARTRASGRAAAAATRRPTSPQPTISKRGTARAGAGRRASSGLHERRAQSARASLRARSAPLMSFTDHHPARRPQLRGRARRTDPGRRHPPGRRPALRLPRRRLRLVQEQAARRPRDPRRAPAQGAVGRRGGSAGYILTCCAAPQTDCVVEARSVPGAGEFPVLKMPTPRAGDRRGRPPTWRCCGCSCRPTRTCSTAPASTSSSSCATARAAATPWPTRRTTLRQPAGDRAAHAPHARRQVHRPCVRRDEGEGHPAHGRPVRQLLPARGQRQADRAAGQRHRLRADQGHHRAAAAQGAATATRCCTGAAARKPTCTCTTGAAQLAAEMPKLRYVPVLSEPRRGRLDRPHRLRPRGRDGRPARPVAATRSMPAARR